MTDYTNYIEEMLNRLMPEELLLERQNNNNENVYVKDAPKIKGYFKFISIRYVLTMRDIKKLCVEYINTYVESCLNVAKNMDDVRIMDEQNKDTLAKDLDFSRMGINTNGEKKSTTTKEGVLFLTGDKALLDKVNAIAEKINARAQKNKMLAEWAKLMIIQSKIIANDIVRKETTKLLKEEKNRKEAERRTEERHRREQEEFEAREKERMANQKNYSLFCTKYGVPDDVIKKLDLKKTKIKQMFQNIDKSFFDSNLANASDNTKLDDLVKINQKRFEFYKDCNADKYIKDAIAFATKNNVTNPIQHFRFASYMVMNCDLKKDEYPCPLDIMIATFNNKKVVSDLNKEVIEPIEGIEKKNFINDTIDSDNVFEKDTDYTDVEKYTQKCEFLYLSTLSKLNAILENKGSILTTSQFIAEAAINAQKDKMENAMMLIDVLSDYDNHIALDNEFRSHTGNVSTVIADENGKPVFLDKNDNPVGLDDEELNAITYYLINNY